MASTYYLGRTASGAAVVRKSTNPDFTHAAVKTGYQHGNTPLPSFSTSAAGAARNFEATHGKSRVCEVVAVEKVDAKTFKAATAK